MKSKYQSEYRLSRLIAKMLLKEISEEENLELQAWLKSSPENRERLEIWKQRLICDMQVLSLGNKDRVWKNIQREISGKHSLCRWNYQKIAAYAAVCLLLVGCTGLLMWLATGETYIRPGYSQALLSVTEEKAVKIVADAPVEQVQNYVQTIQSYPALKMKNEDGILHYEVKSPPVKDDREMMYHSLKVPRSGQYQLVLSDGTHVFLNSETELKYPIFFTDNDSVREVHLKGEAYFKVAHNPKSPFIVHTRRGKIKVLGTSFNIQDYADEERTTVTLQEGHIACFFSGGEYEMYPGNQLWLDGDGMDNVPWVVQQADVASAVSWVSGVFEFNDMPLLQIMKQLARWYDIEYTFERMALKEHRFTGVAYRNLPLEKLLDQIEKTTDIHFKIKKRNVTIY